MDQVHRSLRGLTATEDDGHERSLLGPRPAFLIQVPDAATR